MSIEIDLESSAFDSSDGTEQDTDGIDKAPEACRILRKLADHYERKGISKRTGESKVSLKDINNEDVGEAVISFD